MQKYCKVFMKLSGLNAKIINKGIRLYVSRIYLINLNICSRVEINLLFFLYYIKYYTKGST